MSNKLLIFVVTYNAADHITKTLDEIPRDFLENNNYEILIIDDASQDDTLQVCKDYASNHPKVNLKIDYNTSNLGYGGNQKLGYNYAIKHEFDHVVLLHGDGQYTPSRLPDIVAPLQANQADVILGSRMLDKSDAIKGGMPFYKWIGNQVLTTVQNIILATRLAEFHTGYRAYCVKCLATINFNANSDYFDFDTEILIQMIDRNYRFKEIAIPTFYGDEISYVNGFKYAWLIVRATLWSRIVKHGWALDDRFSF